MGQLEKSDDNGRSIVNMSPETATYATVLLGAEDGKKHRRKKGGKGNVSDAAMASREASIAVVGSSAEDLPCWAKSGRRVLLHRLGRIQRRFPKSAPSATVIISSERGRG